MPARTVHQILEYTKVDGTCHHERATQQREQDRRLFTTPDGGFRACARSAVQSPRGRRDASASCWELEI